MSKRKICIIGPFPPIKGGIPQYNQFLAKELQQQSEVYLFSYKRQYPGFLRKNREQIDPGYKDTHDLKHINFLIDSVNPFTWLTTFTALRKINPDVVILPWWVIYWVPMDLFFLIGFKACGIKSLFICHNIYEHEDNFIKQALSRLTLKMADLFIVHSDSEQKKLSSIVKAKQIIQHLLPLFTFGNVNHYGNQPKQTENNNTLNLLFFGFVREYKGLDLLLQALSLLNNTAIHLTIVGEFWDKQERYTQFVELHNIPNISFVAHYVADHEIHHYFNAADVVVLPYRHATGSAVIPLAYSYNKPVLITNVGGLPDAVVHKKTGYIVVPDAKGIAQGITWFFEHKKQNFAKEIACFVQASMSWSGIVEKIYAVLD